MADIPEGEQATYLAGVLSEYAEGIGGHHLECGRHHGIEQRVYQLIVDMLRTSGTWNDAGLFIDRQQGEGEFMPARANWMRSTPVRYRASNIAVHEEGTPGSPLRNPARDRK